MNSSFVSTVMAVLSNQMEIPELPMDKLVGFSWEGTPVEQPLDKYLMLKVVRLQNLCLMAESHGEQPSYEETKQIAEAAGVSFMEAAAKSLSTGEDMTQRCIMLERLIVELVRENIPTECHHFYVQYYINNEQKLMRREMRRQRFLD